MTVLTIGQIAKHTGVTVATLRFYEKQQLIEAPMRADSGYRQFPEITIKRVLFIQHAKDVGFTLNEIRELLTLQREPGTTCSDIKLRALQKIELIDSKLQELNRIRKALSRMVMKCKTQTKLNDCPILAELEMEKDDRAKN